MTSPSAPAPGPDDASPQASADPESAVPAEERVFVSLEGADDEEEDLAQAADDSFDGNSVQQDGPRGDRAIETRSDQGSKTRAAQQAALKSEG